MLLVTAEPGYDQCYQRAQQKEPAPPRKETPAPPAD
jgi:hypothetical protein